MVYNLAEPISMNIRCDDKILPSVLCMKSKHLTITSFTLTKDVCSTLEISINQTCYWFDWANSPASASSKTERQSLAAINLVELQRVKDVFQSINANYPGLMANYSPDSRTAVYLQCQKLLYIHNCTVSDISKQSMSAYQVYKRKQKQVFHGTQVFTCTRGGSIMLASRCDQIVDCLNDQSDETDCFCPHILQIYQTLVSPNMSQTNQTTCGNLFYMTKDTHCVLYASPGKALQSHRIFINKDCLHCNKSCTQNDLILDWDFDWMELENWQKSEEGDLIKLLQGYASSCSQPMEIPCRDGHSKCFNISQICVFSLNNCKHLYPCRNGGHMQNCRHFQCNKRFKCDKSYCIPWIYVCDNKWDCPGGEDETADDVCGTKPVCLNMFKCWNTKRCIHLASTCDGTEDCPSHDDEELKFVKCPQQCVCFALAIYCTKDHTKLSQYPFIAIRVAKTPSVIPLFLKFAFVQFLWAHFCNISATQKMMISSQTLLHLDLEHNLFSLIPNEYFSQTGLLHNLILSNNRIKMLFVKSFENLAKLTFLSLSKNPIAGYPNGLLSGSINIRFLSVSNITFVHIHECAFHFIKPKVIKASDHKICCIKPRDSVCTAHRPWF